MSNNYVGATPPTFPGELRKGDYGKSVKLLQEMLCLAGFELTIDQDFGNATESALLEYQKTPKFLLEETWEKLTNPFKVALRRLDPPIGISLEELSVMYADRHLFVGARELKNKNLGPWIRIYTGGFEGIEYPWCSYFLCFCIKQAAETLNLDITLDDIPDTGSCDDLATTWGIEKHRLENNPKVINKGAIFLIRKLANDWIHTGFVLSHKNDSIITIEGNTNMAGEREGIAVMKRVRRMSNNIDIINKYSRI